MLRDGVRVSDMGTVVFITEFVGVVGWSPLLRVGIGTVVKWWCCVESGDLIGGTGLSFLLVRHCTPCTIVPLGGGGVWETSDYRWTGKDQVSSGRYSRDVDICVDVGIGGGGVEQMGIGVVNFHFSIKII